MLCVTETFAIPAVPHLAGERKTFSEIFQKCYCPTVLHLTGNMGSFTYLEQCPCKKILVHACLSSGPAAATTHSPTSTALASTSHLKHSQYPQPQRSMQRQQNMRTGNNDRKQTPGRLSGNLSVCCYFRGHFTCVGRKAA